MISQFEKNQFMFAPLGIDIYDFNIDNIKDQLSHPREVERTYTFYISEYGAFAVKIESRIAFARLQKEGLLEKLSIMEVRFGPDRTSVEMEFIPTVRQILFMKEFEAKMGGMFFYRALWIKSNLTVWTYIEEVAKNYWPQSLFQKHFRGTI